jgi:hypothetical protein
MVLLQLLYGTLIILGHSFTMNLFYRNRQFYPIVGL